MKLVKMSISKMNYIYNTFYQLLLIIIPLITTPYISRVLGVENVGIYSYSNSIAYYFVMFIMLGLNNYGNRSIAYVKDDKKILSKVFNEIYFMQFLLALFIIFIYIISGLLLFNNSITWIMLIYVISALFDINWLFFGLEKFKITVIRNSIIKIISTILIFVLVKNTGDLYIYALINVASILLSQIVLWFYVKKYVDIYRVSLKSTFKHIKPNLILFIPVVAISLYKIMDKIMLGSLSTMKQVGFYESTEKIVQVPLALITSLGTVMMPKISYLIAKNKSDNTKEYIEKSIYFVVFIASAICFGIISVSSEFVPLYYGKNYEPCIILFKILMPSCLFLSIANVIRTQFLIPNRYDKIYIISVITGAVVNLIINFMLIPRINSVGAAIGTLVAEASVCIMQLILIRKKIKIFDAILKSLKYVLIGIIMYMSLLYIPSFGNNSLYNLMIKIIMGGSIYIIFSFFFIKKDFFMKNNNLKNVKKEGERK